MARPTKYVSRSDLGWGSSPAAAANPQSGLVVHYDSNDQNLASKAHSSCEAYWNNTRAFHTGTNGWVDLGYAFLACAHGYVVEGRGLRKQQAAQPGGNATHYSVTLATGPSDTITPEQINAVRELRRWLMDEHGNAGTVLGHRDFIATSCPGDRAYRMVQDGTFTADLEGDDVPDRNMYTTSSDYTQPIPAGEWTTVRFDRRWEDNEGWQDKEPEPSFVFGPAYYVASAGVRVAGLERGQEFQLRFAYYRETESGSGRYERYASMPIDSPTHDAGSGHFTSTWSSHVSGSLKGRVRLEAIHYGSADQDVQITSARADALHWKG